MIKKLRLYSCPECRESLTFDSLYDNLVIEIDIECPCCHRKYSGKALIASSESGKKDEGQTTEIAQPREEKKKDDGKRQKKRYRRMAMVACACIMLIVVGFFITNRSASQSDDNGQSTGYEKERQLSENVGEGSVKSSTGYIGGGFRENIDKDYGERRGKKDEGSGTGKEAGSGRPSNTGTNTGVSTESSQGTGAETVDATDNGANTRTTLLPGYDGQVTGKSKIESLQERLDNQDYSVAYELGCLYKDRCYSGDNARAFQCFLVGAKNGGDKNAMYEVGLCYRNGMGVAKNRNEAFKWWDKAAKAGHDEAQRRLSREDDYNSLQ